MPRAPWRALAVWVSGHAGRSQRCFEKGPTPQREPLLIDAYEGADTQALTATSVWPGNAALESNEADRRYAREHRVLVDLDRERGA